MKYIIWCLLIVVSSAIVYAQPLNINPSSININVPLNVKQSIDLQLKNNNEFDIFNVTFTPLSDIEFPFIPIIAKNTTIQLPFNLTRKSSGDFNLKTNISFDFFVDIISNTTTHNIDINSNGFNPSFLNIKKNDRVIFKNKDTITINVVSEEFNVNIQPNLTYEQVFTTIKTLNVTENVFTNVMSLAVINNTQRALSKNVNFNNILNIAGNVILPNGTLLVIIPNSSFSADNAKTTELIIRVKNLGNTTLEHVKLSSSLNWIEFTENDFNLLANEDNALFIKIRPNINKVEDTGKIHNLTITAKADNSNQGQSSMDIFVRLDVFAGGSNVNLNELVETLRRMLEAAQDAQSRSGGINGTSAGANITILRTKEQDDQFIRNMEKLADSTEATNDFLRQTTDNFGGLNPKVDSLSSDLKAYLQNQDKLLQETIEKNRSISNTFVLIGLIVVILFSTVIVYKGWMKRREGMIDENI